MNRPLVIVRVDEVKPWEYAYALICHAHSRGRLTLFPPAHVHSLASCFENYVFFQKLHHPKNGMQTSFVDFLRKMIL